MTFPIFFCDPLSLYENKEDQTHFSDSSVSKISLGSPGQICLYNTTLHCMWVTYFLWNFSKEWGYEKYFWKEASLRSFYSSKYWTHS